MNSNASTTVDRKEVSEIYSRFVSMSSGLGELTAQAEIDLLDRRDGGDETAVHELGLHTVRFIISRQRKRHPMGGDILEDALTNALLRAIHAATLFDRSSSNRFMAYAGRFIDGALTDSLVRHLDVVGAGKTAQYDASALNKFRYQFCHDTGDLPTDEQVFEALGHSPEKIASLDALLSSRMETATFDESGAPHSVVEQLEDPSDDALTQLETVRRNETVQRAKDKMTDKQREAFELIVEQGLTWVAARPILGVSSDKAIADRLEGAKAKIRKEVQGDE